MQNAITRWTCPALFMVSLLVSLFAVNGQDFAHNYLMFAFSIFLVSVVTQRSWNLGVLPVPVKFAMWAVPLGMVVLSATAGSAYLSAFESRIFSYLFLTAFLVAGMTRHQITWIWRGVGATTAGLAIWGIYDYFVGKTFGHGSFADPNLFGAVMLAGGCLFGGAALHLFEKSPGKAWGMVACVILCMFAAWTAHSRSSWLALAAGSGASLMMARKSLKLTGRKILAVVSLIALIGAAVTFTKTTNDMHRAAGLGESITSRVSMVKSTYQMALDHPIQGVGWGEWGQAYPKYRQIEDTDSAGNRAHNDYLEAWATGGITGALLVLAIPFLVVIGTSKLRNSGNASLGVNLGLSSAGFLLVSQALINFVFHQATSCILLGLIIGTSFSLRRVTSAASTSTSAGPAVKALIALLIPFSLCVGILDYLCSLPTKLLSAPVLNPAARETLVLDDTVLRTLKFLAPLSVNPSFAQGVLAETKASITADPLKKKQLYDASMAFFDEALARDKSQSVFLYRKGLIWRMYPGLSLAERLSKIEPLAKKSLGMDPTNMPMLALYGAALVQNKRGAEGLANIDQALSHADKYKRLELLKLRAQMADYDTVRNQKNQ